MDDGFLRKACLLYPTNYFGLDVIRAIGNWVHPLFACGILNLEHLFNNVEGVLAVRRWLWQLEANLPVVSKRK
jgi:hypothetical protein